MRCCFLCGRNGCGDPLEEHHVFGGANRKKSDKAKLVVDLCGHRCHRGGKNSVQKNGEVNRRLKAYFQGVYMERFNVSTSEFIKLFGKNYILDDDDTNFDGFVDCAERYDF